MSKLHSLVANLLVLASSAGLAAAQGTRVWPPAYASRSGEGAQNTPFTVTSAHPEQRTRSMTTMTGASLPFGAGSVLNQIAYRRDSIRSSETYGATSGGTLTVDIGTVARADRPSPSFARNWSGPVMRVFEGAFDVPAAGPPGGVAPFSVTIPFSQSWTYPGGDMAVDLVFTGSTSGPWRRDAALVPVQIHAEFVPLGLGCRGSNGLAPYTWPYVEYGVPGQGLVVELMNTVRPPNASALENFAINFLGLSSVSWHGVPLPLDLSPIGLPPGCMLRTDIFAMQLVQTWNPSALFGRALALWPIPPIPALTGARIHAQWFCMDTALTSPLPVTLSSACAILIGAADANPRALVGTTIWKYGATGGADAGTLAGAEYVAVTQFGGTFQ